MHPRSGGGGASLEVFVRPLLHAGAVRLKSRAKRAKHVSTRERAAILLASNVGMPVPQIAAMWMTDKFCSAVAGSGRVKTGMIRASSADAARLWCCRARS